MASFNKNWWSIHHYEYKSRGIQEGFPSVLSWVESRWSAAVNSVSEICLSLGAIVVGLFLELREYLEIIKLDESLFMGEFDRDTMISSEFD